MPAESAWATTIDGASNGVFSYANGSATITVTDNTGVKAELYKGSVKIATTNEGTDGNENKFTFVVDKGGVYTVRFLNGEGEVVSTAQTVVADDQAADDNWKAHKAVPSQKADSDGEYWFVETGKAVDFTISDILGIDGKTSIGSSNFTVKYYDAEEVNNVTDLATEDALASAPSEAGSYYVAACQTDAYIAGVTEAIAISFTISKADSAAEFSLYEINEEGTTDDTTFVYNGKDWFDGITATADGNTLTRIGLLVDGKPVDLKVAVESSSQNFFVEEGEYFVKTVNGEAAFVNWMTVNGSQAGVDKGEGTSAGKYTLGIAKRESSDSTCADSQVVAYVDLNVEKFDFSKANVTVADIENNSGAALSNSVVATFEYDGAKFDVAFGANDSGESLDADSDSLLGKSDDTALATLDGDLSMEVTGYEKPKKLSGVFPLTWFANKGTYSLSINKTAAALVDDNFAFSGDALETNVRVVGDDISDTIEYTGTVDAAKSGDGSSAEEAFVLNIEDGQSFDAKKFVWGNTDEYKYNGSNAEVAITKNGEEVSSVDAVGVYKVTISTIPNGAFDEAGTASFYFQVVKSTAGAVAYLTFEGKPVSDESDIKVTETGESFAYGVTVKGQNEAGTILEEGVDYKVELTKDGKKADEIKGVGDYTVTVTSTGGWDFGPVSFDVTVGAAQYDGICLRVPSYGYDDTKFNKPDGTDLASNLADSGYAYTGSPVSPVVAAYVNNTDANGETVTSYVELDPSVYSISYVDEKGYEVKAEDLVKTGAYKAVVTIEKADLEEVYGEGVWFENNTNNAFTSSQLTFSIVNTVEAFTDVKASEWYADEATKAKQLGYMEGLSGTNMLLPNADITRADVAMVLMRMAGGNPTLNQGESYPAKFSDVEADAYYAKAIDWAYKAGVVTGYENGSFGPNDKVTREQLATMLGRFAENVQGDDVSAGEIDGYTDAASVQDFAKEGMAYCIEAGIFGVNTTTLDPQGNATRAQVAAIAVRVMPAVEVKA